MEIKQLDQRTINDAMHRSASRNDVTSWHNFQKGEDGIKRDKKANGCMIDGVIYQEFPRKANN